MLSKVGSSSPQMPSSHVLGRSRSGETMTPVRYPSSSMGDMALFGADGEVRNPSHVASGSVVMLASLAEAARRFHRNRSSILLMGCLAMRARTGVRLQNAAVARRTAGTAASCSFMLCGLSTSARLPKQRPYSLCASSRKMRTFGICPSGAGGALDVPTPVVPRMAKCLASILSTLTNASTSMPSCSRPISIGLTPEAARTRRSSSASTSVAVSPSGSTLRPVRGRPTAHFRGSHR